MDMYPVIFEPAPTRNSLGLEAQLSHRSKWRNPRLCCWKHQMLNHREKSGQGAKQLKAPAPNCLNLDLREGVRHLSSPCAIHLSSQLPLL